MSEIEMNEQWGCLLYTSKAPGMGGKKLWHMYKREFKEGTPLGRDRFLDTLRCV